MKLNIYTKITICTIMLIIANNVSAKDYILYRLFDDSTPSEALGSFGSIEECNLALDRMRRDNPSQHFFCN